MRYSVKCEEHFRNKYERLRDYPVGWSPIMSGMFGRTATVLEKRGWDQSVRLQFDNGYIFRYMLSDLDPCKHRGIIIWDVI